MAFNKGNIMDNSIVDADVFGQWYTGGKSAVHIVTKKIKVKALVIEWYEFVIVKMFLVILSDTDNDTTLKTKNTEFKIS